MILDFFHGKKKYFYILLYISDLIAFLISAMAGALITGLDYTSLFYQRFFLFTLVILILSYASFMLYKEKRNLFDDNDFMSILYGVGMTLFVLVIFLLMFDTRDITLWATLIIAMTLTIPTTTLSRAILSKIISLFREYGYDIRKTVFFGDPKDELIEKLKDKHLGYRIFKITKNLQELEAALKKAQVVFIKMESIDDKLLELMIKNDHIEWKIISSILNLVIDPVALDEFKDYPIINVSHREDNKGYQFFKRLFDIIASGTALVVLSPLFLMLAIAIKIGSPGPVFYKHERLGKNLKPFMLYKFRSMRASDHFTDNAKFKNEVKGIFKMKDDPRVTKVGKFIRRTCIDELGQLINIFKGDMSIVGSRPHLQTELHNYKGWRMARFKVKPGLTGLWQVNGRHELNFDKAVLYDIYYVKHMSLVLDIQIILKTIPAILMTKGRY
ncbi:sugar transferase [Candidatus Woesearchaeota archaeon]|nr:sugar transferase [Candidatus Woesearchaeota archaeon]